MSQSLANDDFAFFSHHDISLRLSTTDAGEVVDSETFGFSTTTCLIYAEKITLKGNIRIPGKTLGLFCTTLALVGDVTIDVSGCKGIKGTTSTTAAGGDGDAGGDGGKVYLFVQDILDDEVWKRLHIKAFGGDGGAGGDTSASGKTGGSGGNGGNGGNARLIL
jgi:hypothetical protein